ncbi:hypothetical protein L6452_05751 [Arctium lappa]|uniref:Uncharacterized protein n=1 Tax=Arctium lappa TaxID=4217 RepID=A0ACB9EGP4_ARCLA|nr:hypothetical protein L6452_05751 [Arctium lappa]
MHRSGESLPVERQTRLESDVCKIRVSLGTRAYSLPDPDGGLCDASMGGRPVGQPTVQFTLGHRLGLDRVDFVSQETYVYNAHISLPILVHISFSSFYFLIKFFLIHPPPPPPPTELSPTTTTTMSTDLQLRQDLPAIRLKIKLPESLPVQLDSTSEEESCTIQLEELEIEECRTPTSPENRIPQIITCPPAPKKQRPSGPSCKRRISEFQFFEIVERDEVESFFRSSYEFINQNSITNKRRRCPL